MRRAPPESTSRQVARAFEAHVSAQPELFTGQCEEQVMSPDGLCAADALE
jgi:hypothetical protein